VSPSIVICWYSAFLLNSLKVDGLASPHSPCTVPCALWLHHIININTQVHLSFEKECRYPIPPLSVSLIISPLLLVFVGVNLSFIPLNPEMRGYNLEAVTNSFETHCKFSCSFGSSKGPWSYQSLPLFRYANCDLDKLILVYFRPIAPLFPNMAMLGLEDTRCDAKQAFLWP
jgi:hypothetical protein